MISLAKQLPTKQRLIRLDVGLSWTKGLATFGNKSETGPCGIPDLSPQVTSLEKPLVQNHAESPNDSTPAISISTPGHSTREPRLTWAQIAGAHGQYCDTP